jgi:hypothetical protein
VAFQEPTKKEQAFIEHFLEAFPSTLRNDDATYR